MTKNALSKTANPTSGMSAGSWPKGTINNSGSTATRRWTSLISTTRGGSSTAFWPFRSTSVRQ